MVECLLDGHDDDYRPTFPGGVPEASHAVVAVADLARRRLRAKGPHRYSASGFVITRFSSDLAGQWMQKKP